MATAEGVLYMSHPKPFIETNPNGDLVVNEEVVKLLNSVSLPVSTISIVGKYRTGKSYLLNRFFDTNVGFNLGATIQAKTKGIWIWIRPHPDDGNRALILLDTEGLHDVEKGDETHDIKLFSLTLLLSGCLLYNATGTLDDVIIQQLHLVSELTDHIRTKDSGEESGNHFNRYFPSFFLVLRDFFLKLEIDSQPCSPDQYLENALKLKKGQGRKNNEHNLPRECIQSFFPRRKCFVLCKPIDDDERLGSLDSVKDEDIKPKFLDGVKVLVSAVLREAAPFQVDGNVITGSRYGQLAKAYVNALNSGSVPCVASAVELLKHTECQSALEEATTLCDDFMKDSLNGRLPVTQDEISQVQKVASGKALDHYQKRSLFDKDGTYVQKLMENLEKIFENHIKRNNEESRKKCTFVLQQLFAPIDISIQSGGFMGKGCFAQYKQARDTAIQQYEDTLEKGPMSDEILTEFLEATKAQEFAIINADKALTEKEKQLTREFEERKRQEEKAKAAKAEQNRLIDQMIAQQEAHQDTLQRTQTDYTEQQKRLMQEHTQDMEEKERTHQKMMKQGLTKQADQYKEIIDEMKVDKQKLEENYQAQMTELQDFQTSQKKLIEEMKDSREVSEKRIAEMTEQLEKIKKDEKKSEGTKTLFGFVNKVLDAVAIIKHAGALSKIADASKNKNNMIKSSPNVSALEPKPSSSTPKVQDMLVD